MCVCRSGLKLQCLIIAVMSLVFYTTLSILAILAIISLAVRIANDQESPSLLVQHYLSQNAKVYLGKLSAQTVFGLCGTLLVLYVIGIIASIILLTGLKNNKPSHVLFYFCFNVQMSILCLVGALLLCLNNYWRFGAATFGVFVLACNVSVTVNRTWEALVQDEIRNRQGSFSDVTLLIKADTEDPPLLLQASLSDTN